MDANKLKVLREIGYQIMPVCGLCKHGSFVGADLWGGCKQHSYVHLKHGREHDLSIHRFGTCPKFEADPSKTGLLVAFEEFLKP